MRENMGSPAVGGLWEGVTGKQRYSAPGLSAKFPGASLASQQQKESCGGTTDRGTDHRLLTAQGSWGSAQA